MSELQGRIDELYRMADEEYQQADRYTEAARNSGYGGEQQYKTLRAECLERARNYEAQAAQCHKSMS